MKNSSIDANDLAWIGGLARALVGEPHAADDLVQDAMVAAIEHPEVARDQRRAWLRTVTRRLAAKRFRREALRLDREREVARAATHGESEGLVESAELTERLAAALQVIDEPYRRTLLLRFLKDLDTAEIGRREGLTPDAVRRRVRHGLELLREELLRRDGRGWSEWHAALLPLARSRGTVAVGRGAATMQVAGAIAFAVLGAAVVLGGIWWANRGGAAGSVEGGAAASDPGMVSLAEPGSVHTANPAVVAPARSAVGAALAASSVDEEEPGVAEAELPAGGVRGRLLSREGAPAAGAKVEVYGWPSNKERTRKHGLPEVWEQPEGLSGEDGGFEIRFDPPLAYQFTVSVSRPGFGPASWRFSQLDPETVKDLGEVVLTPGGSLRLRVLDGSGMPFEGELGVHVSSSGKTAGQAGQQPMVTGLLDPEVGELMLHGLSEGGNTFRLYSHVVGWIDGGGFDVVAGSVTDLDWTLEGVDLARSIHVIPVLGRAPGWGSLVRETARLVREADGLELEPGWFLRRDLEPGTYAFQLDHPYFIVGPATGLETGRQHSVSVKGSASLGLSVLDGPGGEPVEAYAAYLRYLEGNQNLVELRHMDAGLQEGPFDDIVPVPLRVEIDAGPLGSAIVETAQLAPGQTTWLDVVLEQPVELEVRVTGTETGSAQAGLQVVAVAQAYAEPPLWYQGDAGEAFGGTTDAAGVARLILDRAEPVWVAVEVPPGLVLDLLVNPGAEGFEPVAIEVSDRVEVRGRVTSPAGLAGHELRAMRRANLPVDADRAQRRHVYGFTGSGLAAELSTSGEFGPLLLAPGSYGVQLRPQASASNISPLHEVVALGERVVESGASIEWNFEFVPPLRGRVKGLLLVDGLPAAGGDLTLIPEEGHARVRSRLDGAGRLDVELAPGVYGMALGFGDVLSAEPALSTLLEMRVTVLADETVEFESDLTTARRGLRLLEADGSPFSGMEKVRIIPADAPLGTGSWTIEGWPEEAVQLWLPLGRYRVELDGVPMAEFDWEAGDGPIDVTL